MQRTDRNRIAAHVVVSFSSPATLLEYCQFFYSLNPPNLFTMRRACRSLLHRGDEELSGDSPQIPPLSTALISGLRRRVGCIVLRAGETLAHLFTHLPLLFAATLSSVGTDLDRWVEAAGERWRTAAIIRTPTSWWGFRSVGNSRETMRQLGGLEG